MELFLLLCLQLYFALLQFYFEHCTHIYCTQVHFQIPEVTQWKHAKNEYVSYTDVILPQTLFKNLASKLTINDLLHIPC